MPRLNSIIRNTVATSAVACGNNARAIPKLQ
jgi:hypothetical protein